MNAFQVVRWVRYVTLAVSATIALGVAVAFAPTLTGKQVMVVTSGSMDPWAPVGSIVVTEMVEATSIRVGDVITFKPEGGSTTTHRVIKILGSDNGTVSFKTQGDANPDPDPMPVTVNGQVARGGQVIPHLGRVLAAIRTPIAFLALALVGLATSALEKRALPLVGPGVQPMPV
jgi:signal peptidase I